MRKLKISSIIVHLLLPLLTLPLTVFTSGLTTAPQHKKVLTEDTEMHSHPPFCTFFFSHSFVKRHQKSVQYIFCPHTSNCSSEAPLPHGRCLFKLWMPFGSQQDSQAQFINFFCNNTTAPITEEGGAVFLTLTSFSTQKGI